MNIKCVYSFINCDMHITYIYILSMFIIYTYIYIYASVYIYTYMQHIYICTCFILIRYTYIHVLLYTVTDSCICMCMHTYIGRTDTMIMHNHVDNVCLLKFPKCKVDLFSATSRQIVCLVLEHLIPKGM